jgi:hypothetical protein
VNLLHLAVTVTGEPEGSENSTAFAEIHGGNFPAFAKLAAIR